MGISKHFETKEVAERHLIHLGYRPWQGIWKNETVFVPKDQWWVAEIMHDQAGYYCSFRTVIQRNRPQEARK